MSTYVFKVCKKFVYHIIRGDNMYIPTLDPKIVGSVISKYRRKRGVSQEVLSGLAAIGRTHLSAIERGERKPTLETLYRISCALDVRMSEIVAEIEENIK